MKNIEKLQAMIERLQSMRDMVGVVERIDDDGWDHTEAGHAFYRSLNEADEAVSLLQESFDEHVLPLSKL